MGQFVARHVARHTDPYPFGLTGVRVNMGAVINAPLVSIGAKTGQRAEVQLTYFHDGPDVILHASNFGGHKHPRWHYNLQAHPECQFGGERFTASLVTDADEYARAVRTRRAGSWPIRRLPRKDRPRGPTDPNVPAQAVLTAEAAAHGISAPAESSSPAGSRRVR
ncbi:nitroreductase family deazaflavin-dependent oxidoreductase [Mycobacterium sp. 050134]|uniref:nitroreductase family deazaflavin-dependent oxidoreductase n=1 Tax=Mycobacterium sp. 050134 TaxID=3096111 RepID=UPI003FA5F9AE